MAHIAALHQKAVRYDGNGGNALCLYFYRNRDPDYFAAILAKPNCLMETLAKDNSGDPRSPINGRLHGLFFLASVEPGSVTGQPRSHSPFGRSRLLVPAEEMIGRAPNVYFADFYCMKGQVHYVTLVMTRPGTHSDSFCRNHGLRLLGLRDRVNNPFLFYGDDGKLRVTAADNLQVEVFYTEDMCIRGYTIQHNIPTIGQGHTTPGGVPKDPRCMLCN